jgi:hypothetical protein
MNPNQPNLDAYPEPMIIEDKPGKSPGSFPWLGLIIVLAVFFIGYGLVSKNIKKNSSHSAEYTRIETILNDFETKVLDVYPARIAKSIDPQESSDLIGKYNDEVANYSAQWKDFQGEVSPEELTAINNHIDRITVRMKIIQGEILKTGNSAD